MDSNEITRLILNLVRKGKISAVDHDAEKCRVTSGELQTNWIRWTTLRAGTTRTWNPPTVGEQVILLCPGGDPADGIAITGINDDAAPAPSHDKHKAVTEYPDGAVIEYDHSTHALRVTLPAAATIQIVAPGSITIDSPHVHFTGQVTSDGDMIAAGVSLDHHTHGGVSPGGASTGEPD